MLGCGSPGAGRFAISSEQWGLLLLDELTAGLDPKVRRDGHDLIGPLRTLQTLALPYEVRIQRRYNPEGLCRYNIVPGLIGAILTMAMARALRGNIPA